MLKRLTYLKVLGQPPTDLSPAALVQWQKVEPHEQAYRFRVNAMVGAPHVDDVMAKSRINWHRHLRAHGPVAGSPLAYFAKICHHEALDHLASIRKLAQDYIEDNSKALEDASQHVHIATNGLSLVEVRDEVERAMKVLQEEFTPRELTTWLLTEKYQLDSRTIANLTNSTSSSVRQSVKRARDKLDSPLVQSRLRGNLGLAPE
ncbi:MULTISPECIES: hypothetical protein [unclassified Streptomyces]|uniref:hypothetical protein n=1 Tax=unclassified Streptomyces TaxID=2593676 RepID=UPI003246F1A0